ncbi:alanine racemase [Candidatus Berkelbacteria bacterium CG10_big_fil_rev_8_21_14_0_10_43_13]|uniref:Alanine racemase n=1 Tax=Candidatus Berkelbacteria bacterium CG10_big_fil_rev_8_21_14_0_10_43_13 TaxID=1974514 RepID=A0A2H0W5V1_9BACT|nr:MAG: alanine racemase [Candidatus Berkelbacteria bacterium CG10_big_fil_rev_8_21_14_0_10_43_13]
MKKYDYAKSDVRTWLEIDTKKLRHNYSEFRKLIGAKCRLMAVVKSNAYGHGLIDYSKTLDKFGVDWFGVDSFVEAIKLRKAGIQKPILVLGYTLPENYKQASEQNISLTISSLEQLKTLLCHCEESACDEATYHDGLPRSLWRPRNDNVLKVHLKIDTGMHRQGFQSHELDEMVKIIKSMKFIKIEGIYSHFAEVISPKYQSSKQQLNAFNATLKTLEPYSHTRCGSKGLIKHMAASAAAVTLPESRFDMVRIGIGLTGIWPSEQGKKKFLGTIKLLPVMSWKTIITEIKTIESKEGVGYGFSHRTKRKTKIAILPIGYWHGFKWSLSNKGCVLVSGQSCPVIGRVCMDMTIIDVTDLKSVSVGDIVTIIGSDGENEMTVEKMAELAGSYRYEIITTINPLIQKIYR